MPKKRGFEILSRIPLVFIRSCGKGNDGKISGAQKLLRRSFLIILRAHLSEMKPAHVAKNFLNIPSGEGKHELAGLHCLGEDPL